MSALVLLSAAMPAEQVPARIRGNVVAVNSDSIVVKQADGRSFTLKTGPYTSFAEVVPSSLEEIRPNEYIGTASKGAPHHWVAVEIVIFPESLQAGRLAYASWDPLPDYPSAQPATSTATTMTNGVVSRVVPASLQTTETTMTNGTVTGENEKGKDRLLTLTLVDGQVAHILVPAKVPVTRFVPADRSAISVGSAVFVKTDPGSRAGLVAAGKGLRPPM